MFDMKEEFKKLNNEMSQLRQEQKELKKENNQLKIDNESLKKKYEKEFNQALYRIEQLERKTKVNNVVLTGMIIDTSDTKILTETVGNFIEQHLEIKPQIKIARKLGEKTCLIELHTSRDKEMVMANKAKLKNIKGKRLYINNDLTVKERDVQKNIRTRAKEEREKGSDVKIGYNKISINGVVWRWSSVEDKLVLAKN